MRFEVIDCDESVVDTAETAEEGGKALQWHDDNHPWGRPYALRVGGDTAPDGGESEVRAVSKTRNTPLERAESNLKQEVESWLDTGMASGVGIAAMFGSLGYLIALNVAVSQGYADQAIFLDPNVGVVTAGFFAGAGALVLGYNMGWQAASEGEDG